MFKEESQSACPYHPLVHSKFRCDPPLVLSIIWPSRDPLRMWEGPKWGRFHYGTLMLNLGILGVPMGTRFSTNPFHPVSVFLLEWNGQLSSLIWPCLSNFLVSMMLCHPQGNSSRPFYLDLSTRSNRQVQSKLHDIIYMQVVLNYGRSLFFVGYMIYIYIYIDRKDMKTPTLPTTPQ